MKWLFVSFLLIAAMCFQQDDGYREEREQMVRAQIKARGVHDDATLSAMRSVPRHMFVPEEQVAHAYQDHPLPIGNGQTISQPYIVAFMTEAIRPQKHFRVLEVGTGSGYQAAVLAEIVDSVFSIEIIRALGVQASNTLKALGYSNVVVKLGDGYQGWQGKGPFDAIVVTAAAPKIPPPLIEQLKEGGRMIIPVGASNNTQQLILLEKENGEVKQQTLLHVRFVPFTRD